MNMDNQQETGLIGWLAGILDGEGSVVLTLSERGAPSCGLRLKPGVVLTNTDPGIIKRCIEALDMIGVGRYIQCKRPAVNCINGGRAYKPITTIEISGLKRVKTLLDALYPYLAGDKHARATVLLEFINRRLGKPAVTGKAGNTRYDEGDAALILKFMGMTRSRNIDHIARILNEHTRGTSAIAA